MLSGERLSVGDIIEVRLLVGGVEPSSSLGWSAGSSTGWCDDEGSYISCNGPERTLGSASSGLDKSPPSASAMPVRSPGCLAFSSTHPCIEVRLLSFFVYISDPAISNLWLSRPVSNSPLAKPCRITSVGSSCVFAFSEASLRRLRRRTKKKAAIALRIMTAAMLTPTAIPTVLPVLLDEPELLELGKLDVAFVELMATSCCCEFSENTHCEMEKFWRSQSTIRYLHGFRIRSIVLDMEE